MLEGLIDTLLSRLREIVASETVIGKPISAEGATVIPITKISLGFMAGGGGSPDDEKLKAKGTGLGGGALIEPLAIITIQKGEVKIHRLNEKSSSVEKLMEIVPEVIEKYIKPACEKKNTGEKT
ncbi:MAG: spore germination protein GerW family protein [Candidatus Neomarinimicrobiota bacterium]